jgi:hypothetical protein
LLPGHPGGDIAQKHPASKFTITAGRGGPRKPSDEGETDMTSAAVSDGDEICELTIDELDQAGGGMFPPGPTVVDAGVFHTAGIIVQG